MTLSPHYVEKAIRYVNRKKWWHVPPVDQRAYKKRGKFLSSSFSEAEFWGRPLNKPVKVSIAYPLIGDEATIMELLFGTPVFGGRGVTMKQRFAIDARIRRVALENGFDSVLLMNPKSYFVFRATGKLPRSLELNVLDATQKEAKRRLKWEISDGNECVS